MQLTLLLFLLSLDLTMNQKVQNDRANPSYQIFPGKNVKGNGPKILYQSEVGNRSQFSSVFRNSSDHHKRMAGRVPPYAVLMEPVVHYSQPDPLFKDSNSKEPIDSQIVQTDKINKIEKREHNNDKSLLEDNENESTHNTEFSSYGSYYEGPYHEEPEPIIEIIIKESNQSVATAPATYKPPPKKKKEPVQVFYVKYKKDPSAAYGEDKIIYESPIPAVTPPTNNENSGEETEEETFETKEAATLPPSPSTTLKAIIRPDSEIYHGTGLHITFGEPKVESSYRRSENEEQQSAPQVSVSLPDRKQTPLTSRSSPENQLNKRHPAPFNGPVRSGEAAYPAESRISYRPPPPPPPIFQQTPQFPAQPFRPVHSAPSNLNNQYSTLPLHLRNPNLNPNPNPPRPGPVQNFPFRPEHQNAVFPQQPYQTIKLDDPTRYSPTARPVHHPVLQPSFHSPINQVPVRQSHPPTAGNRPNPVDQQQHREQVEQLNRLQQEQQRLQAEISERNKKPNFAKQSTDSAPEIIKSISPDHEITFSNHRPDFPIRPAPESPPHSSDKNSFPRLNAVRTGSQTTKPPAGFANSTQDEKKIKEEKKNQNAAALPKEVPDDLREQLLSSGILNNADIQILDYDKIGDIPVENLPPEALANFQAVAGSEPVTFAAPYKEEDSLPSSSEKRNIVIKSSRKGIDRMEMKVVRFNPESNDKIADKYMKEGATRLEPVVLNDSKYNRYLPLKISGAQFPVPDVPELKGRNVTSVVILAPVDYEFLERRDDETRLGRRSASPLLEVQGVHFVAGDVLKDLVKIPNYENYRKWLDKENRTAIEKQSVVLLVVEPAKKSKNDVKDIFMYDIATQRINKLKGELSSTFVKVAESNSQNRDLEEISDNPSAPGGDFTIKNTSEVPP